MKVLLFNGSPRGEGCTYTALTEAEKTLREEGIDTEIFSVGKKPILGCIACHACSKLGKCAFGDQDGVNLFVEKAKEADGFIFGAPVHYASIAGAASSFLDRVFYSNSKVFARKPGAAVVSCRRAGSTASLDQLNKYFTISNMPVVSAGYWNMVHGSNPEQVRQDLEGMQMMRDLGRHMAWLLKCIEAGRQAGVPLPKQEDRVFTNFIR
ncbi:MAG: flavodoxin family protein [Ruminococcaceae bacterium]|jgi:multimeric flavodoxin WrbA|nr:flavodoxin family protein [Oscillospiraceae bacterium]